MNFTSYKSWLLERKASSLSYGCLMLYTDFPKWPHYTSLIDPADIYTKDDDYGIEKEPHITIIYGLHDDELDKKEFYQKIENTIKPVTVTVEQIGFFEIKNEPYDVVKIDVPVTSQLKKYRDTFIKYPNTQTYPEYKPHMTLAYVKSGKAEQYASKIAPFTVTFNQAVYSSPTYRKKYFTLK